MILERFEHRQGVHCGSAALADALRVRGVSLSEPMVFGLGAGLGFYYFVSPALSPTQLFLGRSAHVERTACEVLEAPIQERQEDDPARAWEGVRQALDRGIAPIVITDLSELPYWRTRTRFGGHRVVVAGYDASRSTAWLADADRPGLEEVSLADLERARSSAVPPFSAAGSPWFEVDAPARSRPLEEAVPDALRRQAREALIDVIGASGVSALERFAADLPEWPRRASGEVDRAWCFRFAYQVVEKRGTGGGLFRAMYARFLEEAEAALPGLARLGLAGRMRSIAASWSRLAAGMRAVSEAAGAPVPPELAALAREIARDERRYHEDVAALVR